MRQARRTYCTRAAALAMAAMAALAMSTAVARASTPEIDELLKILETRTGEPAPTALLKMLASGAVDVEKLDALVRDPNGLDELLGDNQGGGGARAGGPDAFGYTWLDSNEAGGPTFSWADISATGTLLLLGDDELSGPHPIGFCFDFYGIVYEEFSVSSNG